MTIKRHGMTEQEYAAWLQDADERRQEPLRPDSPDELRARLDTYSGETRRADASGVHEQRDV